MMPDARHLLHHQLLTAFLLSYLSNTGKRLSDSRDFQEIKYTASQNDNHYNEGGQGFPFATLDLPKYT